MRRFAIKYIVVVAPFFFVLGCARHAKVTDPLPLEQIHAVLQKTFLTADSDSREVVSRVISETDRRNFADAWADAKSLANLPKITMDQRIDAIRASETLGKQLVQSAQSGDQQAAETLRHFGAAH
jgi:hypothetical protein